MAEKEYIERKDLINNRPPQRNPDQTGKEEYNKGYNDGIKAVLSCIEIQPSADVAPVRHGHWEVSFLPRSYYGSDHDYEYTECECSVTCSNCHGIASCFPWKKQEDSTGFIKAYQKGMIKNAKTNYCPNCGAKMGGGDLNGS